MPPCARWDDVEPRVTRGTATGEVLERRHAVSNPARAHAAGQKLDRVRDIETIVTLLETPDQIEEEIELIDLTVDSDGGKFATLEFERLEAGRKWADCDVD